MTGNDDGDDADPPRRWVEALLESEEEVRSVLDETRDAHLLGEYETVRERLRAFSRAEDGIFRAVALVVLDSEGFYDDLDAQYDEAETAPTDDLRAFGAEYDRLSEEFGLIYSELSHDLRNPMPALRRGFRYSRGVKLPLLDYDLYSGDVKLCQFVHPPSQALVLARSIVANTSRLLEHVEENDDEVAPTELELLALVYEDLEAELSNLEALVDRDPGEDGADEPEVYQDWSVY